MPDCAMLFTQLFIIVFAIIIHGLAKNFSKAFLYMHTCIHVGAGLLMFSLCYHNYYHLQKYDINNYCKILVVLNVFHYCYS